MHFSTTFCSLAIAVAFSQAISIPVSHVVHEKRDSLPPKWAKRDRLDARAVLPVRIGLTQRNLDKGSDLLMDISHPDSANFGNHYTSEQIAELFKPSEDTKAAVKGWLASSGVPAERITTSSSHGWIDFDATTEEIEKLLHTEFYEYEHTPTGEKTPGCDKYHVPEKIREHVDFVVPGIILNLPMKTSRKRSPNKLKRSTKVDPHFGQVHNGGTTGAASGGSGSCDLTVTPDCIAAIYHIPAGTKANPSNAMGIFEFGDVYSPTDLDQFFTAYAPSIPVGTAPKAQLIDGAIAPVAPDEAGGESTLDFELSYPIVYPQELVLFQSDDSFYTENFTYATGFFNNFLDAIDGTYCTYSAYGEKGNSPIDPKYPDHNPGGSPIDLECGIYEPTNVISISYGFSEADPPVNYQKRQCDEFMKLGLLGTTVVVASGDSGVAERPGDDDESEDGCLGKDGDIFSPGFPVSCPYLTTVGATTILPGNGVNDPESAVTRFGSGGGFSNIYGIPDYQTAAVSEYFKNHNPPYKYYEGGNNIGKNGGVYNRIGRGFPDVAALGDNIVIVWEGSFGILGGTSASAPIFASVINRINEERIAVNKKSLGFINPSLYANPDMFNDITQGNNPGCNTTGFAAVEGWDPVTGLGTPNYTKMLAYLLALP